MIAAFNGDDRVERRYFLAVDGVKRLEKYRLGTDKEFHILRRADGQVFRLSPKKRNYYLLDRVPFATAQDSLSRSLINQWLNEKRRSDFTDLGLENGLRKYKVDTEDALDTEIFIFVDENIDYPVRQEFYSVTGKTRKLNFIAELRGVSTDPDPKLFEIPPQFAEADPPSSK